MCELGAAALLSGIVSKSLVPGHDGGAVARTGSVMLNQGRWAGRIGGRRSCCGYSGGGA